MTFEKTIKHLVVLRSAMKHNYDFESDMRDCIEDNPIELVNKSIEALEKQIPKKVISTDYALPLYDNEGYWADALMMFKAKCPCCGQVLVDGELEVDDCVDIKYCDKCGQALDWGIEENMQCCRDCKHYRYREDKCYLGSDKYDCVDFEPQDIEEDELEDDE